MRLTLIFILVFTFQSTFGQVVKPSTDESPQELFDYYTYKQKKQKKAAWIVLGTGLTMTIVGGVLMGDDFLDDTSENNAGALMVLLGIPTTLVSVPLFIIAGSNKRKANLALKGESMSLKYIPIEQSNYVALSLTIPLGK